MKLRANLSVDDRRGSGHVHNDRGIYIDMYLHATGTASGILGKSDFILTEGEARDLLAQLTKVLG
jgi:hypothetical protein